MFHSKKGTEHNMIFYYGNGFCAALC
uniref:Uncharacterized protein n=1 Tax=Anguilla anguilla TaxID=7936 RepID=A0A0E9STZ0_ANGAN